MNLHHINDPADPRLTLYRNVKNHELAAETDLFMAEGLFLVKRLLRSSYPYLSILCAARKAPDILPQVHSGTEVYLVPDSLVRDIVGFKFHTGVLAVGQRLPAQPLDLILPPRPQMTVVILPETNNLENLGSIARLSAAFGVDALILGPQCADPFYRQALRASVGNLFSLPLYRSPDLFHDLPLLRDRYQMQLAATVLSDEAQPLATTRRPDRLALLFGSEANGLSSQYLSLCNLKLTIPMAPNVDSLNVSASAAIFLYHFTQLQS